MKKVPCSYPKCGEYRVHYERPDEPRGTQMIDVPDDFDRKAYCSISCACMDGAMTMANAKPYQKKEKKIKWTTEVPKAEGWYWCHFLGRHGDTTCPCLVIRFGLKKSERDYVGCPNGHAINDAKTCPNCGEKTVWLTHKSIFLVKIADGPNFYSHSPELMKQCALRFGPKLNPPK